jgi:hypothetical protein
LPPSPAPKTFVIHQRLIVSPRSNRDSRYRVQAVSQYKNKLADRPEVIDITYLRVEEKKCARLF